MIDRLKPDVYTHAALRIFVSGCAKLIVVILLCALIIVGFSWLNTTPSDSLLVITDPGFLADMLSRSDGPSPGLVILEMIIGIILMGAVVSVITETVFELATVRTLASTHRQIKRTFGVHKLIATRKLLKGLGISAETRNLPLTILDEQLRITKDQINRAIDLFGGLRLRYHTAKEEFVVENVEANVSYGTYNHHGRSGRICVISTQSSSDAGVGHFAKTLSDLLDSHYISNEYFSSGSLLPEKQINFASNERYADFSLQYDDPHGQFMADVLTSSRNADIVVYVGTVSEKRKNDLPPC